MRKKYLSALLFGALLFASAGTFTSCKDYDDDINNLQEQINTINTTLTELKGQIGTAGVSSVTFDEATGVLTVVDGKGTTTYKINTVAQSMVEAEIKDGVLTINGEEIGAVVGEVTVENGKLMVDGKEVASLGGESNVVLVKNEDNQTCTLTVGDQTVTLPLNADATTAPAIEILTGYNSITHYDVAWGVAEKDITFGNTQIAAGKLLLGGMTQQATKVAVKPVTYDLSAQTLKLVDMYGNEASVKVVAGPATISGATTGSRAADVNGEWFIQLSMLDTVTEENIATVFTKEVNGVDENLKYALTVNGTRVTGYNFVIDTQTENESKANAKIDDKHFDNYTAYDIETGDQVLSLSDFGIPAKEIVASYLKVEDVNTEAKGIKADGMTVSIPATNAGAKGIVLKLYTLDVTGATSKHDVKVNVKATTSSSVETASPVAIRVTSDNKFTVDLGTIFQNLDANIVLNINNAALISADRNFFALTKDGGSNKATELVAEASQIAKGQAIEFVKSDNNVITAASDLRSAVKAVVTLPVDGSDYVTGATNIANIYGAFNLNLILNDEDGNVLKTVVVPVTVSKPEFSDYYTENSYAGWANGTLKHVITSATSTSLSTQLFDINKKSDGQTAMISSQPSYKVTYTDYDGAEQKDKDFNSYDLVTNKILKQASGISGVYDLEVPSLKAKASNNVATIKLTEAAGTIASSATNISVEKEFTLNLVSMFADVKVAYFTNNVAGDKAIVVDNLIAGYADANAGVDGAAADFNGLAFQYGKDNLMVKVHDSVSDDYKLNGFKLLSATIDGAATGGQVEYSVDKAGSSLGGTPTLVDNGITIDNLNAGEGGKLTFTFVDEAGIRTTASIDYVKQ